MYNDVGTLKGKILAAAFFVLLFVAIILALTVFGLGGG